MVVEPQSSMIRQRVKSIGIGLTDRVEGPYELLIHRMWATNGLSEAEMAEERRICGKDALNASAPEFGNKPSLVEQEAKGIDRFKRLKKLGKE
jgi:NADH dehydrogenase [ubiquinone] 1 alpha subcomplex assembly factor 1